MGENLMKTALKQHTINDEIYTPEYAVKPLLKYLPKDITIWECTDYGESKITKVLKDNGYKVITSHIKDFDFLKDTPEFEFDMIITNPPYSLKTQFLKRCYEYQKPFALLLPITALEGKDRNKLYQQYGLEIIILDKRVNFLDNKKTCWFNTSWFCWKLLKKTLNFERLEK